MPEKPGFHLHRRSWTSECSCCTPMQLVQSSCCMSCQKLACNTHARGFQWPVCRLHGSSGSWRFCAFTKYLAGFPETWT